MQAAQGQLRVVWGSYTYIQGCRTLCSGTSSLQLPSVERSEAPQAPAHAIERTWATKGAGKRAPSSSRSARFVRKSGRQEEDAISGGRIDYTCARKSKVTSGVFWELPKSSASGSKSMRQTAPETSDIHRVGILER